MYEPQVQINCMISELLNKEATIPYF